jgi:hypothetical protein
MGPPIRVELANVVAVQRLHEADPGEHCWPVLRLRSQDQGLNGGLPFLNLLSRLLQFLDVSGRVFKRDELATAACVNRRRSMTPPVPNESKGYRADRRRDPTPINMLRSNSIRPHI